MHDPGFDCFDYCYNALDIDADTSEPPQVLSLLALIPAEHVEDQYHVWDQLVVLLLPLRRSLVIGSFSRDRCAPLLPPSAWKCETAPCFDGWVDHRGLVLLADDSRRTLSAATVLSVYRTTNPNSLVAAVPVAIIAALPVRQAAGDPSGCRCGHYLSAHDGNGPLASACATASLGRWCGCLAFHPVAEQP